MVTADFWLPALLGAVVGLVAAGLPGLLAVGRARRREAGLVTELAVARRDQETTEERLRDQRAFLTDARTDLENSFRALATAALEGSSTQFLKLAEERLGQTQVQAAADLDARRQAIEGLLSPLRETLGRLESRTGDLERSRVDAYARIHEQVKLLARQTVRLEEKTTALNSALRGNQVRGRWGELALRNVAELAGMTAHCDFFEQSTLDDGSRPDMVVRLPGGRVIAVDAKASLSGYLEAVESSDPSRRAAALKRHAQNVRGHVRALAARDYAGTLPGEVDLTVLFLPGDPFLASAYEQDPELQNEALRAKVLIATPTTLVALLRTVAVYWEQRSLAENAERIAAAARELYERTAAFSAHLGKLGRGLGTAVESYNRAVGSFERRILPLGKTLEELRVAERSSRSLESPKTKSEPLREVQVP